MRSNYVSMSPSAVAAEQQRFMVKVYNWMTAGLAVTGFMAYYVSNSETMMRMVVQNSILFFGLIIVQLGLVVYLSGWIQKMSASLATGVFILYAGLNGLTFSFIFLVYTASSITAAFFVTAGTFAAMSLYGYTTKKDLTSWGS
ncbi:MAG: Bax inhibitor-1 family protein, partial [Nitrospinales bacterium]